MKLGREFWVSQILLPILLGMVMGAAFDMALYFMVIR